MVLQLRLSTIFRTFRQEHKMVQYLDTIVAITLHKKLRTMYFYYCLKFYELCLIRVILFFFKRALWSAAKVTCWGWPAGAARAVGNDDGNWQGAAPQLLPRCCAVRLLKSRVQVCVGSSWNCDLAGFCGSGHRNMASRGAADVAESRGKLWLTTGVNRAGKL